MLKKAHSLHTEHRLFHVQTLTNPDDGLCRHNKNSVKKKRTEVKRSHSAGWCETTPIVHEYHVANQ